MIRWLKWLVLGLLALMLVTVALANRGAVTLRLLPDDLAAFLGLDLAVEMPLFLVILGGVAAGLLIGFLWEWLREHRHRADASARGREIARLERELASMRDAKGPADEVLALIDRRKAS